MNFDAHEAYLAQCHETALEACTGDAWKLVPGWTAFPGSVPDVVRRGDTLYIFTPGRVRRVSALDGSVLGEETATIPGTAANGGSGWVDPSPTIDDEGRLVLFFLYCVEPGTDTGTMCFGGAGATPDRRIGSAVEVEGSDGATFTLEMTPRLECTGAAVPNCTDPDVFFDGSQWLLYVADGPGIAMYAADSLHGAYAPVGAGQLWNAQGGPGGSVPSGHFDGNYFTFGHSSGMGTTAIRRAIHASLAPLAASDWTLMLEAKDLGLPATMNLESPGFAPNMR